MPKNLDEATKWRIVELRESGVKELHVVKQLGITHSAVNDTYTRWIETGTVERQLRSDIGGT